MIHPSRILSLRVRAVDAGILRNDGSQELAVVCRNATAIVNVVQLQVRGAGFGGGVGESCTMRHCSSGMLIVQWRRAQTWSPDVHRSVFAYCVLFNRNPVVLVPQALA